MLGWDSRVRHPQAPCVCPAAPALPTPNAHFPLSGLCSLSCTRPGLHHSWLCLQSSRWRSEARCPPPRFPLNSFYSLLDTPPPSSPLRPTAPAPGELSSLPGGSQLPFHSSGSPGRPGGYTGKEKEAGWGWGGGISTGLETALLSCSPTQLKAVPPSKGTPGCSQGLASQIGHKVGNFHLLN